MRSCRPERRDREVARAPPRRRRAASAAVASGGNDCGSTSVTTCVVEFAARRTRKRRPSTTMRPASESPTAVRLASPSCPSTSGPATNVWEPSVWTHRIAARTMRSLLSGRSNDIAGGRGLSQQVESNRDVETRPAVGGGRKPGRLPDVPCGRSAPDPAGCGAASAVAGDPATKIKKIERGLSAISDSGRPECPRRCPTDTHSMLRSSCSTSG